MSKFIEAMKELESGLPPPKDAGFLGVSLRPEDCRLVIIPVPWEATTSYGGGTSGAPEAIVSASHQLDMEDAAFGRAYRAGITVIPIDPAIHDYNESARASALKVIEAVEGRKDASVDASIVNQASSYVNDVVYKLSKKWLSQNKFVSVVGGDHSCPYGLIKALGEVYSEGFGVLHFDAHHDLRKAYEGFEHSHASIFYNVMTSIPAVSKLVQVGIRDYSRDEKAFLESLGDRGECFYGRDLFRRRAEGETFKQIASSIVNSLPDLVYVSFDIDGLDPSYCPSTGTPVPGGLSYDEACYILEVLAASGKKVVGFDLCEVTPSDQDEWDANVGARMLYKLCGCLLRSQQLC